MSGPSNIEPNIQPIRKLSKRQESRLVDYVEDNLLEISGQYKKRAHESSRLRTLNDYLLATRPLLSVILLVPPLGTSASLRTSLLLRLTGEVLDAIPNYPIQSDTLDALYGWLSDLEQGWLTVLRSQLWDTTEHAGKDLILPEDAKPQDLPSLVSQTDRTRLRSILILGTEKLEDFLSQLGPIEEIEDEEGETLDSVLEDPRQRFADIFGQIFAEMGSFS
ncbi:hypothetical protein SISNIDRAFT_1455 [Sistotremastrum niveocremeum HHB9708]|uniref:Uncharacterized protein n=2 Tax=Sistotremastraceae TaxID=3402574 RepID=A0A165ACU0_9AGAM|nr:hypothetical protein SISNIDRAFT_1455 [Sistotremastrum niveocremeum HHB9708]KZT36180.1 hypothetical protein SISSUDRAFT_989532 [Sistotremastrum suecicum HHB10207 ss-3]